MREGVRVTQRHTPRHFSNLVAVSVKCLCEWIKRKKMKKGRQEKKSSRLRAVCESSLLSHGSPVVSERLRRNRCYLPCRRHSWTRQRIPPSGANLLHRSLSVHLLPVRSDRGITGLQSPALCPPPAPDSVFTSNNHL